MRAKNKKIYKKALPISAVALGVAVLGLGAAAIIPQFQTWTSALRGENTFISIQSPDEIKLEISPQDRAAGKLVTASDYASIKTDSPSGYTLSYSVQGEAQTNELVNKDDDNARIASLSDVAETATFPVNHWGVSTDGEYWAPLPAYGQSEEVKTTTEPTKEDRFDFSIGVKVDSLTPSGEYTNTLCLTAVTNTVPTDYAAYFDDNADGDKVYNMPGPFIVSLSESEERLPLPLIEPDKVPTREGYTFGGWTTVKGSINQAAAYSPGSEVYLTADNPTIQLYAIWVPNKEMGFPSDPEKITTMQASNFAEVCANVQIGETGRFQDIRDYKIYYVTKEADSKCWMTQNLALEINKDRQYTPEDTNIKEPWIPTVSTLPPEILGQGVKEDYLPMSYNPGDQYYPSSENTDRDSNPQKYGNAHYAAGNVYNWTAAIATNDSSYYQIRMSAPTSVCPRGWHLPHVVEGGAIENSEFLNLIVNTDEMFGPIADEDMQHKKIYTHYYKQDGQNIGFNKVRSHPLWLVRAGGVPYTEHTDTKDNRGLMGMYHSDTVSIGSTGDSVYQMYFDSESIYSADYGHERSHGATIRCVAQP